jgi:hypothetical protein
MMTTFTTCLAASSAGNPRHDFAALSEDNASQMPSDAIINRPPAVDNYHKKVQKEYSALGHVQLEL